MSIAITPQTTDERLAKFENQVLAHPVLESVYHAAHGLIRRPVVPIIEIAGPTGVGKSTLLEKLRADILLQFGEAMITNPGLMPVIMVELKAPENAAFSWGDFYARFLKAAGEPMINNKSLGIKEGEIREPRKKPGNFNELRWAVEQCIHHRETSVVIIDEAQHLTKVTNARRLQDQMDAIKSLASLSGVQFLLVGTYELLTLLNQNGQLARRTRCIHFHRYKFEEPGDRQALLNILGMFESRLPVKAEGLLTHNMEYIYENTLGCIGMLKDWLRLASNHAVEAGRDSLEMRDLKGTAQTRDALLQILQEILEGERSIEAWTNRGDELRTKLGLKPVQDSAAPLGGAKASATRRAVGERKPSRDLVGV
jgi:hypothetical protein